MLESLARELIQAEVNRAPVARLMQRVPDLTKEQAYAIQAVITDWRLAQGRRRVGYKIGYTTLEAQRAKSLDEPMWCDAFAGDLRPDGSLAVGGLIAPKVEPEIVFRLRKELYGPGVTEAEVLEATEMLSAAFEVIDSRYVGGQFNGVEGIADSGVHACLVWAEQGTSPRGLDLAALQGRLERNGELIAQGTGAAVLGHPARAVAWLANSLARFDRHLRAGELISSGTLSGAHVISHGDRLRLTIDALGTLEMRLA